MNIGVVSLGCAKNLVDTENMLGLLYGAGFKFVSDPYDADILIVNTCGFILPAKQESINAILEMAEYKKHGRCKTLVATGCLIERYREELKKELPEVDIFIGVHEYDKLPALLNSPVQKDCLPRLLLTPPYRAYLRIGDGCSNRCTYCAIPLIRKGLKSVPEKDLIDEAKRLADLGVTELTLIAQDTSGYGRDIYGKPRLIPLLKELDRISGLHWIRVLYTYPDTVNYELLDTLSGGDKLVPYLDMPLQHINDDILRAMNRRGDKRHICSVLDYIRTHYPNFTLRTTMMVGFPSETEAQFAELMQFLRDYPFDRVGCFAYSIEENTAAADMENQIPDKVKQERLDALMRQQQTISLALNQGRIGEECELLIESMDENFSYGRTMRFAPDADGQVLVPRRAFHGTGCYIPIRLTEADCYDMRGESL
ncbi:MAG: 30S ribosomal protein S12 methylthiotransferase RimO [Clostridia bacterium]|nr:30S ribosomal protein S12 methylthiotransferase RimO [Clostridia bacterium]